MNVLQIVPELNAGGVERTTLEMAEALMAKGHTPHVASAGGRMEDELAAIGAVLHRLDVGSKNPLKWGGIKKQLIEILRANNIDVVHARSRAPAWPAYGAAKAFGVPFLTTYHGIYNSGNGLKRYYNSIMTRGERIIANSEYTKAHIIKEHGSDAEKIIVIPRAVDIDAFDLSAVSPANINVEFARWGLPLNMTFILLPGRLTRWKGQLVAIEALSKLPGDFGLICLGDAQGRDKYVSELSAAAKRHGVESRVSIPGHTRNVPAALAAADIVISASTDPEAFGRVAAEAQAMQRPVVATAHGGALETVVDNETGFLVPPGDARALAAAIKKAASWEAYDGAAARRRIEDKFSKARLQRDTLALYHQLLL